MSERSPDRRPSNIQMLGVSEQWVAERIALCLHRCHEILEPLVDNGVDAAVSTVRLVNWVAHVHAVGDYRRREMPRV